MLLAKLETTLMPSVNCSKEIDFPPDAIYSSAYDVCTKVQVLNSFLFRKIFILGLRSYMKQIFRVFSIRVFTLFIFLGTGVLIHAQERKDTIVSISIADTNSIRCAFIKSGASCVYVFAPVETDSSKTLPLTIFMHGYNGYQPELYGGWINSLVQQKSVVIFPVYQNSLLDVPANYYEHSQTEIHLALTVLQQDTFPKTDTTKAIYITHSLGGSITMKLLNHLDETRLPYPTSVLLTQTGSGMLKLLEEDSYDSIPKDLLLLCFSGEDDLIVHDFFADKVMENTPNLSPSNKYQFVVKSVKYGRNKFRADHFVPCSYMDIVPQKFHLIAKNATMITQTDFFDTEIYWKTSTILLQMMHANEAPDTFSNHLNELFRVGKWPDGERIDALEGVGR